MKIKDSLNRHLDEQQPLVNTPGSGHCGGKKMIVTIHVYNQIIHTAHEKMLNYIHKAMSIRSADYWRNLVDNDHHYRKDIM